MVALKVSFMYIRGSYKRNSCILERVERDKRNVKNNFKIPPAPFFKGGELVEADFFEMHFF